MEFLRQFVFVEVVEVRVFIKGHLYRSSVVRMYALILFSKQAGPLKIHNFVVHIDIYKTIQRGSLSYFNLLNSETRRPRHSFHFLFFIWNVFFFFFIPAVSPLSFISFHHRLPP